MHRLLVDSSFLANHSPLLPDEARRHLKVVRPRDGEAVELFDGRGATRSYCYDSHARALFADGEVVRRERTGAKLTLFACVTKGSRWDWTIEKATELGVWRIVPVISERTIVRLGVDERAAKRDRWRKIAEEAARQSDALWLPEVVPAVDFPEALRLAGRTVCFAGALADPPPEPLLTAVLNRIGRDDMPDEMSVFVGPEGDFTPEELSALIGVATPTSFGDLVLRAETAAIYGITVLAAAIDATRKEKQNG